MRGNKYQQDVLREYARKLSDEDLRFLQLRLTQRVGSDVADAVEFMQRSIDLDRWLATAQSASDFFDMVDLLDTSVQQELRKRFTYEKAKV